MCSASISFLELLGKPPSSLALPQQTLEQTADIIATEPANTIEQVANDTAIEDANDTVGVLTLANPIEPAIEPPKALELAIGIAKNVPVPANPIEPSNDTAKVLEPAQIHFKAIETIFKKSTIITLSPASPRINFELR